MPVTHLYHRRDFAKSLSAGLALGTSSAFLSSPVFGSGTKQLGIAVVGLGRLSTEFVLPALEHSSQCRLAGVVSGSSAKADHCQLESVSQQAQAYSYQTFDRIADDENIDVVYIAVPNAMHEALAVRAARAGKHVVVAAPLAESLNGSRRIEEACATASRNLIVANHASLRPSIHAAMKEQLSSRSISSRQISLALGGTVASDDWRCRNELAGGGAVLNYGTSLIQAARSLTGSDPIAVTAQETKSDAVRFANIDQSMTWAMHYADGSTIHCSTSYSTRNLNCVEIKLDNQTHRFCDAFTRLDSSSRLASIRSMARELDQIALDIRKKMAGADNSDIRDLQLIEAVYRSSKESRTIDLV